MTSHKRQTIARIDWLLAALCVALAAVPRLLYLDLAEFKLDEATHYHMAYFLTRGAWRWVGSTASVGIPKPPLFVYALALPLAVTRDPRIVSGFLGLLAALSTGAFYLILRRHMGRAACFSAALLFAINPQAILFSRKLFTADLLPPLCTALLGAGSALLAAPRPQVGRWAVVVALAFGLLCLTTFSPALLLPAVLLLLWQRRQALQARDWLATALAFGLPFLPYLATVGPGLAQQLGSGGLAAVSTPAALASARPAVHRWLWNLLFGAPWPASASIMGQAAALALLGLSAGGVCWLVGALRQPQRKSWALFVWAWLGLTPLLAWIAPLDVQPHYLVVLYPLLFVLPAAAVQWAAERDPRWRVAALAGVLLLAAWQGHIWLDNQQAVAQGVEGYGTPLGYWWRAAQQARSLMAARDAGEILLVMPGDEVWDEKAHILDALLSGTTHRVVDGQLALVFPPHPTVMVLASEVTRAATQAARCTVPLTEPLPASPFGGTYDYRLWSPTGAGASLCVPTIQRATARWDSGAELVGLAVQGPPCAGQPLPVTVLWQTMQPAPGVDVHWFNHLVDATGRQWGQFDHAAWPAERWQPGDEVLTTFDLPVDDAAPAGSFVLRMGQYLFPDITNIPLVDEAGNPTADTLAWPLP